MCIDKEIFNPYHFIVLYNVVLLRYITTLTGSCIGTRTCRRISLVIRKS